MWSPKQLADLLKAERLVDERSLFAAHERAMTTGEDLASACLALKLASEKDLVRLISRVAGFPGIDLSNSVVKLANLEHLPYDVIKGKLVLPVGDTGIELLVAMADPEDRPLYDELRFLTGRKVLRHVAVPGALKAAIDGAFRLRANAEPEWRGREAWKSEPPPEGKAAVVKPTATEPPRKSTAAAAPAAQSGAPSTWLNSFFTSEMPPPARTMTPGAVPAVQVAPAAAPSAPPAPRADPDDTVKADRVGSGRTVLVVDDDDAVRELSLKLLRPFGCATLEAGDGKQALAMAREFRPEVVLLDAMLPGMHGFEVCRALKGDPELRRTGVIMVSGIYTGWKIAVDVKEVYGADYFFEKPFRIEEVSRAVRILLLGAKQADAIARVRREEALKACREAVEQAKTKKLPEAIALLQAAAQKDPFSAEPQYYLALAYRQASQPYQAVAALERAVDLRPDLDQPLILLADLYLSLGFRKTAREVILRAREVCSDDTRRRELDTWLAAAPAP